MSTDPKLAEKNPNGHHGATKKKKSLILNGFVTNSPGHVGAGLWKAPDNTTPAYLGIAYWQDLARLLESAGFHSLFLADTLGCYDSYMGPGNHGPALKAAAIYPVNDPALVVPVMAAVTKNLSFGITVSTTYEKPFALARKFTSLDHLTDGRVSWNIVTSYLDSAAANFGLDTQIPHDERYKMAEEYMEVVYKLWEGSWRDDAVVRDRVSGHYGLGERVRPIDHRGAYFSVRGPHICEPSRQRTPLLFQAGTSRAGSAFAARHAEAVFVEGQTPEKLRPSIEAIRAMADENGRDGRDIKFILAMTVVVDQTDAAAEAKRGEYVQYMDLDGGLTLFGGWTGIDMSTYSDEEDFRFVKMPVINSIIDHWTETVPGAGHRKWTKQTIAEYLSLGGLSVKAVGCAKTVVDTMERWVDEAGVDGFNLYYLSMPGSYEDIIKWVVPELRARGLFREGAEREGMTARETYLGKGAGRLLDDHPGAKYRWRTDG